VKSTTESGLLMTDDEQGDYEDTITRLRRIIKAWEDGRIERHAAEGEITYFMPFLCRDGDIDFNFYPTPAEAYAALEKDGEL